MKYTLEHVTKSKWIEREPGKKKKLIILNDISLQTCGDDVHAILGPSGSGKTTLLRLLNKLESPDQGQILLDGQNIAEIPARVLRKDVGMVFQVPALFPGTVEDNVLFGPQLNEMTNPYTDIRELLEIVGMKDIESSRDVANLSVGQQQRVSFARALANQPKMLLLDEPTSALDPSAAKNLLDLVKKIYRDMGIGIVMVTHIMQHAQRIADYVCLLVNGKIVEHGLTKYFFRQPQTEIGQKFIRGEL